MTKVNVYVFYKSSNDLINHRLSRRSMIDPVYCRGTRVQYGINELKALFQIMRQKTASDHRVGDR